MTNFTDPISGCLTDVVASGMTPAQYAAAWVAKYGRENASKSIFQMALRLKDVGKLDLYRFLYEADCYC